MVIAPLIKYPGLFPTYLNTFLTTYLSSIYFSLTIKKIILKTISIKIKYQNIIINYNIKIDNLVIYATLMSTQIKF
jgi:hypothetical protein